MGIEGTSAVLPAGLVPASEPYRGGVEEAEELAHAPPLLRYSGGLKGGCFERIEVIGSCGGSLSAWRYLVTLAVSVLVEWVYRRRTGRRLHRLTDKSPGRNPHEVG